MADDDHCISCARAVSSAQQKFCPDCGQATPPSRIDWQYVGNELQHGVLQMDRGILYSLKELMLSPGTLLRDYIQGRRGNQAKPLLLITLMAAVVVLLSRVLPDAPLLERVPAAGEVPAVMARFLAASEVVNGWITGHFAAFTLMLLPVEAAVKCWVFRRYSRLNYPEWLVITTLLTVQALVIWSLLLPLQRWIPQQPWLGVLVMIYGSASLLQFFRGRPLWSTLWRVLLGYALFVLIAQVLLNAAIVVLMLR